MTLYLSDGSLRATGGGLQTCIENACCDDDVPVNLCACNYNFTGVAAPGPQTIRIWFEGLELAWPNAGVRLANNPNYVPGPGMIQGAMLGIAIANNSSDTQHYSVFYKSRNPGSPCNLDHLRTVQALQYALDFPVFQDYDDLANSAVNLHGLTGILGNTGLARILSLFEHPARMLSFRAAGVPAVIRMDSININQCDSTQMLHGFSCPNPIGLDTLIDFRYATAFFKVEPWDGAFIPPLGSNPGVRPLMNYPYDYHTGWNMQTADAIPETLTATVTGFSDLFGTYDSPDGTYTLNRTSSILSGPPFLYRYRPADGGGTINPHEPFYSMDWIPLYFTGTAVVARQFRVWLSIGFRNSAGAGPTNEGWILDGQQYRNHVFVTVEFSTPGSTTTERHVSTPKVATKSWPTDGLQSTLDPDMLGHGTHTFTTHTGTVTIAP